jgi:hypothetical protein
MEGVKYLSWDVGYMFALHTWKVHSLDHGRWVNGIRGILPHHEDVEGGVWAKAWEVGGGAISRAWGHRRLWGSQGDHGYQISKLSGVRNSHAAKYAPGHQYANDVMNPQNRTLPSPRLGFVVGLSIYASTPSDQERSMGWFPGGDHGTGRAVGNGRWRDWERRIKGRGSEFGSRGVEWLLLQMKKFRVVFAKLPAHRLFWNRVSTTFVSN